MKAFFLIFTLVTSGVFTQNINSNKERFDSDEKSIFQNIQEGDALVLNYTLTGCFSLSVEKIVFRKIKDQVKAELFINKELVSTKLLTGKDLNYLIAFERNVRLIKNKNGGCTNSETYNFLLNEKSQFSVVDSSCNWNGYGLMKSEIFNIASN